MKNSLKLFVIAVLLLSGTDAFGQNSFGYKRATHPEGERLTFGNVFGFGNINGLLPGAIYFSFSAGPSFLLGDITGPSSKAISLGKNNMVSLGVSRVFRGRLGYELSFMYGQYDGSDVGSPTLDYRGYSYDSKIGEIALTAEFYLFGGPYARQSLQSLYLFGGLGLVYSGCDSYGKPPVPDRIYQHTAFAPDIPFGACYLIGNTRSVQIGVEASEHYVFNDYLDGVKPITTGNKANDILAHFALKLRIHLYQDNKYE